MTGPTVAVVPVNHLDRAKSRLAARLDPPVRAALVLELLRRVLAAIEESGVADRVVVVSPDRRVLARARSAGAATLEQRSEGLNPALAEARGEARSRGAGALLVVLGDLPWLAGEDLRAMARLLGDGPGVVLAPDRRLAGTNALLLRPADALPFHFGPGSFERHRAAAARGRLALRIYRAPGTAFDLDVPDDLATVMDERLAVLDGAGQTCQIP